MRYGMKRLRLRDDEKLVLGDSDDMTLQWDGSNFVMGTLNDDSLIEIGDSAATQVSYDLKWYANEAAGASYVYFDASANLIYTTGVDIQLKDADYLVFGTGSGASGDVNVTWDATNLVIASVADGSLIEVGDSAASQKSFDIKIYGHQNTGASYLYFDESADLLYTTGVDLQFTDADYLVFGTGAGAAGDVNVTWDGTNLIVATVADDKLIEIGDSAATQLSFDWKWYANENTGASYLYADASDNLLYTVGVDLQFKDSDYLVFGTGAGAAGDVNITWDGTNLIVNTVADDKLLEVGDSAATQLSFDVKWYANENAGASYLYCDASDNNIYTTGVDLQFKDADLLTFGTGAGKAGDVNVQFDGTSLIVSAPVSDDLLIEIGDSAATQLSFDVKWYGGENTGASYVYADASANAIITTGVDLQFSDNDVAVFGTGTGVTGDVGITYDGNSLNVTPVAASDALELGASGHVLNTTLLGTLTVGVNDTGYDVILYGATAGCNLTWDESDDRLEGSGNATVQIGESTTGVTTAGGTTMVYGYAFHKTNALTGTLRAVRGNARINVASAAGVIRGGEFYAGNGSNASATDGVNLGEMSGVTASCITTTPASAATVTKACGLQVINDTNQATTAITSEFGIRVSMQTGSSQGTHTNTCGISICNEDVEGTGAVIGAGLQIGNISRAIGFTYLIDMAPSFADGGNGTIVACSGHSADIRFSNGCWFVASSSAITANTTTTTAPAGSIAISSNGTGYDKGLFRSDGSKWQFIVVS